MVLLQCCLDLTDKTKALACWMASWGMVAFQFSWLWNLCYKNTHAMRTFTIRHPMMLLILKLLLHHALKRKHVIQRYLIYCASCSKAYFSSGSPQNFLNRLSSCSTWPNQCHQLSVVRSFFSLHAEPTDNRRTMYRCWTNLVSEGEILFINTINSACTIV